MIRNLELYEERGNIDFNGVSREKKSSENRHRNHVSRFFREGKNQLNVEPDMMVWLDSDRLMLGVPKRVVERNLSLSRTRNKAHQGHENLLDILVSIFLVPISTLSSPTGN